MQHCGGAESHEGDDQVRGKETVQLCGGAETGRGDDLVSNKEAEKSPEMTIKALFNMKSGAGERVTIETKEGEENITCGGDELCSPGDEDVACICDNKQPCGGAESHRR